MIWLSPTIALPEIAETVLTWNMDESHHHWIQSGMIDNELIWITLSGELLEYVVYWAAFPNDEGSYTFCIPEMLP